MWWDSDGDGEDEEQEPRVTVTVHRATPVATLILDPDELCTSRNFSKIDEHFDRVYPKKLKDFLKEKKHLSKAS